MNQLLVSPWIEQFDALVESVRASLVLCAPYIGRSACERINERLVSRPRDELRQIYVLTDLSLDNMLSGATDVTVLLRLVQALPQTTIRVLPSLHAKVYVADTARAVVTSANLTGAGLSRNFEYGMLIADAAVVKRVRKDVIEYGDLAAPVDKGQLKVFSNTTLELRDVKRQAERSIRRKLRREFKRRLRAADDEVLRVRTRGRTPHAIFADAILHVLRTGPKEIQEIHSAVKAIHPDLCDDSVERVIDGKRFGKKWKHAVRTAQQHLKRRGQISYHSGVWHMTESEMRRREKVFQAPAAGQTARSL
jgi:hypothetical protein